VALACITFALCCLPLAADGGNLVFYDPDLDFSMGLLAYSIPGSPLTIHPGPFAAGYFSLRNPILVNYFNLNNVYNILEAGLAINRMDYMGSESLLLTAPILVDFAYRIRFGERFAMLPFVGSGIFLIDTVVEGGSDPPLQVYPVLKTGVELRYRLKSGVWLKLKGDYGVMFVNDDPNVPDGYAQFLRIRFPVPFIP
jgi:hypothetical protein